MEARQPPQQNSSRTVVIAAVCILLVIAIAGIVLAKRAQSPAAGPAPEFAATAASGSTSAAASGPTSGANEVVFSAGSDKVPGGADESIDRFAEGARGLGGTVRMTARFLTGANKVRDLELAKGRMSAVRQRLQTDGIKPEQMQMELIEMPAGSLVERDGTRIELSLR